MDICGYAVQIAAQLGAHIIKVKLPTAHIEQEEARKVYNAQKIPIATLSQRAAHVVQCAFNGRRIVIFSGGLFHEEAALLDEVRAIHEGGGFGSVIGRNMFQRPKADARACSGRSWTSTPARSRNRSPAGKATDECWPPPTFRETKRCGTGKRQKKGTGTICRNGLGGAAHEWLCSPFPEEVWPCGGAMGSDRD